MKKQKLGYLKRSIRSAADSYRGVDMAVYSALVAAENNVGAAIEADHKRQRKTKGQKNEA